VKKALEGRNGVKLAEASIAVAGRDLRTVASKAEREFRRQKTVTTADVKMAEIEAVNTATMKLRREGGDADHFPVGFAVTGYHGQTTPR